MVTIPYSIGEFANIIGLTTSTLRYYEKEGLLTPHRNDHNIREFTDQDIDWDEIFAPFERFRNVDGRAKTIYRMAENGQ
nr:MerR family transcriptional regulator [Bacillus subtilis]